MLMKRPIIAAVFNNLMMKVTFSLKVRSTVNILFGLETKN